MTGAESRFIKATIVIVSETVGPARIDVDRLFTRGRLRTRSMHNVHRAVCMLWKVYVKVKTNLVCYTVSFVAFYVRGLK